MIRDLLRRFYTRAGSRAQAEGFAHRPTQMAEEVAISDPTLAWNERSQPYNPSALVTAKGLEIFDRMMRDDQIKAAIEFKRHAVVAAGWRVHDFPGSNAGASLKPGRCIVCRKMRRRLPRQ